jgi:hypothetical protein
LPRAILTQLRGCLAGKARGDGQLSHSLTIC